MPRTPHATGHAPRRNHNNSIRARETSLPASSQAVKSNALVTPANLAGGSRVLDGTVEGTRPRIPGVWLLAKPMGCAPDGVPKRVNSAESASIKPSATAVGVRTGVAESRPWWRFILGEWWTGASVQFACASPAREVELAKGLAGCLQAPISMKEQSASESAFRSPPAVTKRIRERLASCEWRLALAKWCLRACSA